MCRKVFVIASRLLFIFILLFAQSCLATEILPNSNKIFINRDTANGLASNQVNNVYVAGGKIYAATIDGLSISTDNGKTFANSNTDNGLGSRFIQDVTVSNGTIYAACTNDVLPPSAEFDGGLSISTDDGKTFSNSYDGFGSSSVTGVYVQGCNIYVATISSPRIFGPTLGGLAISTDGGKTFINRTTDNGLGSNQVLRVYVYGNTIYAATENGLSISSDGGKTFVNRTTVNGLGSNMINDVYVFDSKIYVATDGGLSISLDGGYTFVNKTTADGLGSNYVGGVFFYGNTIYAATHTEYAATGIPTDVKLSSNKLKSGGLSFSTDGGITFTNKTTANGLGSNDTFKVFATGNKIYVATDYGLSIGKLPLQ